MAENLETPFKENSDSKRSYEPPKMERIEIDRDMTVIMMSTPPPDPPFT